MTGFSQALRLATPRKVLMSLALAAASTFSVGGLTQAEAAGEETVSIETARGQSNVPHDPQTVVVYDLATLDTLDALGIEVAAAPSAPYPDYLAKYAADDVEKVGTLFEADLEAVAALGPDLIVTGGRSSSQTEALSQIAPTIDMTVDEAEYYDSALARARAIGKIFDKEEEVDRKIATLERSIAELNEKAGTMGTGLIVLTTGNRMSAFGPGSRFGLLHGAFGVTPADTGLDIANHGEAVSFEYIAKIDPDWLFVLDRDAAIGQGAAASMLENELVAQTKAWKADQVVYLDSATWYLSGSGLTAMQRNVDQIADAFAKAGENVGQ
ncbi:siderophore ABC transporter substrate-binding protein [Jiella marina]|uniref:siderophore ABC transporter substrate-binding protein n=1 Tax=Jiella sp. LLJ827 TaxID=2917712 RepID=UPI0021011B4B|nr:siderophore ABC transporter substrate-binding protein [Jiella sp. LLJ827]MCQ0986036.1 siderophore ABC transporter substrate-binding protein [Jiella sp. LLJ827]